ncbi:MAG: hypothetical protein ACRDPM_13815 [Solirubrobacteraceae bacterium]
MRPWHETNPSRHTGAMGAGDAQADRAAAADRRDRGDAEERRGGRHDRGRRRSDPASDQTAKRRLGPPEYMLLAVIAVAIAITIAMAVIDPSG